MTGERVQAVEKDEYRKPLLMAIDLKAEEVLGTGCKISGGTLPNIGSSACGISNTCVLHGS